MQRPRTVPPWAAGSCIALLFAFWLLAATGRALPRLLGQLVGLATLVTLAAWAVTVLVGRAAATRRGERTALLVPALLALALIVRCVGLGHEAEGRYYDDEGTYYHYATQINGGEVFPFSFVYPHLTYYADAFALWLLALAPARVVAAANAALGFTDPLALPWTLLRGVVALLSALTVLPVFRLGAWIAGRVAGTLGALLLIFSPLFNEGSHLNTCDVPSAFFAAVCLVFVARLVDLERPGDYALAGVAAGLAAASKYPAGVVAVAIVAVWIRWRIARRNVSFGLLVAGLAAIAAFVAAMPALLVYPKQALFGSRGMLFGAHQYASGGWLGVTPASNWGWYSENLVGSFGWMVIVLGLAGLVATAGDRQRRARILWIAPFPIAYLLLVGSMNMVVRRNLYPVLPPLATFLGVGIAWWLARIESSAALASRRPVRLATVTALTLACLAAPLQATAIQDVGLARPSTREVAAAWIRAHVPRGTTFIKESYTPDLPPEEYRVVQRRFVGRFSLAELRAPENDYLLLASAAYGRFLRPELFTKAHQGELATRYQQVFSGFELARSWQPSTLRLGPELRLYRVPLPPPCADHCVLPAGEAFVPDGGMRSADAPVVEFTVAGQWVAFRPCLEPGVYRVGVDRTGAATGELEVVGLDGIRVGTMPLSAQQTTYVRIDRRGRYLVYVRLTPGERLSGIVVERI